MTNGAPLVVVRLWPDGDRRSHASPACHQCPGGHRANPGSLTGAVRHTDLGSQETSGAFTEICRSTGVRQGRGAVGSSADSASESFNAAFKRATLKGRKGWSSEREARLDAFRWLTRYNTRRRHSRLGQQSPVAYETSKQQQPPWPEPHRHVQHPESRPHREVPPGALGHSHGSEWPHSCTCHAVGFCSQSASVVQNIWRAPR
ncbi:integrase core domain-containing protein [Streptomyces goshikiensis]|uniref:integrase core domain-containing protein n=1 Tax=Streptomyces goshikiensis TaxID=1942 RepID=UPI00331B6063